MESDRCQHAPLGTSVPNNTGGKIHGRRQLLDFGLGRPQPRLHPERRRGRYDMRVVVFVVLPRAEQVAHRARGLLAPRHFRDHAPPPLSRLRPSRDPPPRALRSAVSSTMRLPPARPPAMTSSAPSGHRASHGRVSELVQVHTGPMKVSRHRQELADRARRKSREGRPSGSADSTRNRRTDRPSAAARGTIQASSSGESRTPLRAGPTRPTP